jgi:hypothetical protein
MEKALTVPLTTAPNHFAWPWSTVQALEKLTPYFLRGQFFRTAWSCVAYTVASWGRPLGLRMSKVLRRIKPEEKCLVQAGQACFFIPFDIDRLLEIKASTVSGAKIVKVNLMSDHALRQAICLTSRLTLILCASWGFGADCCCSLGRIQGFAKAAVTS